MCKCFWSRCLLVCIRRLLEFVVVAQVVLPAAMKACPFQSAADQTQHTLKRLTNVEIHATMTGIEDSTLMAPLLFAERMCSVMKRPSTLRLLRRTGLMARLALIDADAPASGHGGGGSAFDLEVALAPVDQDAIEAGHGDDGWADATDEVFEEVAAQFKELQQQLTQQTEEKASSAPALVRTDDPPPDASPTA